MRPRIKILPDEDGLHYCGLFEGGYSSVGAVRNITLEQAIRFYLKVFVADWAAKNNVFFLESVEVHHPII